MLENEIKFNEDLVYLSLIGNIKKHMLEAKNNEIVDYSQKSLQLLSVILMKINNNKKNNNSICLYISVSQEQIMRGHGFTVQPEHIKNSKP